MAPTFIFAKDFRRFGTHNLSPAAQFIQLILNAYERLDLYGFVGGET